MSDERVILENVPRPTGSCSSIGCIASVLQHRGETFDYTYLMGAGGRAFRLQFSWCPSAPHAAVGYNTVKPTLAAAGYAMVRLDGSFHAPDGEESRPSTPEEQTTVRDAVKAALDTGDAVIMGSEEDGVLAGYEPASDGNPTGWLRRPGPVGPPPPPGEPYVLPVKGMPWGFTLLKKDGAPADAARAARTAIGVAVDNMKRTTVQDSALARGFAAWDKWITELAAGAFTDVVRTTEKELEAQGRTDENALWSMCLGNAWTYENLYFARLEAARYLRSVSDAVPAGVRPHLNAAADAYEQAHHALVPEEDCFTKIAPYPFMMKDVAAEWTDALRTRQADLLKDALVHEKAAVAALGQALEAW